MNRLCRFLFYFVLANVYLLSLVKDHTTAAKNTFAKLGYNYHTSYGGRLKYLTYIDLNFQSFYFVICTICAFFEYFFNDPSYSKRFKSFIDLFFTCILFPLSCIVTTSFWGVFYIDRNLIYPEIMELVIPFWQNHVNHTLPLFSGVLECYLNNHSYSKSFRKGLLITWIGSFCYIAWVFIIAYHGGFWVYDVLRVLGPFYRFIFILSLVIYASILYKVGEIFTSLSWRNQASQKND